MFKGSLFSKLFLTITILFSSINLSAMYKNKPQFINVNDICTEIETNIINKDFELTKEIEFEILEMLIKKLDTTKEKFKLTKKITILITEITDFILSKYFTLTESESDAEEYYLTDSEDSFSDSFDWEEKLENKKLIRKTCGTKTFGRNSPRW